MDEKKLFEIKKKIEDAQIEKSELAGRKKHLLTELEKNFKCKSLEEAQEKLETLRAQKRELEEKLEQQLEELEELYNNK